MAKQTFTTGQVLTAAQMTSLQQTAMLGGDATAKTASYVLTAADAGGTVTMNSSGTTTITVNTSIFSAGDTVTIINLGSGVSTITAGTATVSTSGSLALSQNQGGILRFTSASAAIFLQFNVPPASSGGMTLLSTTTLTGANTDINSISQDYNTLEVWIYGVTNATSNNVFFGFPRNGTTVLDVAAIAPDGGTSPSALTFGGRVGYRLSTTAGDMTQDRNSANNFWVLRMANYASTTNYKSYEVIGGYVTDLGVNYGRFTLGHIYSNSAVNSLRFQNNGGNFTAGTVKVYGVK